MKRQPSPLRPPVFVALLVSALALAVVEGRSAPGDGTLVAIAGNRSLLPAGAQVLGPVPDLQPMRLIVALAPRHGDRLDSLVRRRRSADAGISPGPLSPEQFADQFGATPDAQAAIMRYLTSHGLRIVRTYPDRLLLDLVGSAEQVRMAFGTPLVRYRDRRGRPHVANRAAPRLPASLARLVSAVIGLRDDGPPLRTSLAATRAQLRSRGLSVPHTIRPLRQRPDEAATTAQPPAHLLTPAQLRAMYDIAALYTQTFPGNTATVPITGTGQTIALLELSPFDPTDIAAYDAAFGLQPPAPVPVGVDGGATESFGTHGRLEAALDIELVQAVAPGAQILVYNGPGSPSGTNETGADDTYARMVNDNRAQVLSTSWGQCEPDQNADTPPDMTLLHTLFAQAMAQGMSVLASTGDSGANDCTDGRPNPSVDYPASDPAVLAVGGTTVSVDSAGHVQAEVGWIGSGGGPSAYYQRPAWQTGPGLPASSMRLVPDVASDAGAGYAVYVGGGWQSGTGTSTGPPVWAGLLALANQSRYAAAQAQGAPGPLACATPAGLGDLHPALYRIAASPPPTPAFRDITSGGDNGAGTPGPGWDAVTGWGVPDAAVLAQALRNRPELAPPAPVPCATGSASPTATATISPLATASPSPTATPPAALATSTATSMAAPPWTPSPMPSSTPSVTAIPSASPTPTGAPPPPSPAATWTLASPTGTLDATPLSGVTATVTVSATCTATATPAPVAPASIVSLAHPSDGANPPHVRGATHVGLRQGGTSPAPTAQSGAHAPARASRTKPKHPAVARLLAWARVRHTRSGLWVQLQVQWEPHVRLYLMTTAGRQPQRHVTLSTDGRGVAVFGFPEARPPPDHVTTLILRVWGVYRHQERLAVLRVNLTG